MSQLWTRITHIEWLGYICAELYLSAPYVSISWHLIKHRGFCTFTAVNIMDAFHHMVKKLPAFFFKARMVYHCMQERPAVESSLEMYTVLLSLTILILSSLPHVVLPGGLSHFLSCCQVPLISSCLIRPYFRQYTYLRFKCKGSSFRHTLWNVTSDRIA